MGVGCHTSGRLVAVLPDRLHTFERMPKLYEYFGLIFLFYSDDHDPPAAAGCIKPERITRRFK